MISATRHAAAQAGRSEGSCDFREGLLSPNRSAENALEARSAPPAAGFLFWEAIDHAASPLTDARSRADFHDLTAAR